MRVTRIDHVHMEVADRERAADWYGRVLGLERSMPLAVWAQDPMGPLILNGGDGAPALSLFARASKPVSRDATVAFRVSGGAFLGFLAALDELGLKTAEGEPVTRGDVVDHDLSWSLYFRDPDGNRLEVTTYDHAEVAAAQAS